MIAVAGDEDVAIERAELRLTLDELVARASIHRDRAQRDQMVDLAGRLAVPAAAFLRPELECRLVDYVEEDDSFARDQVARILALACGISALPALLRALIRDRNDDGDTLQLDVLVLMDGSPGEALGQARACIASHDPGLRRVGVWCLSVMFGIERSENVGLVVAAASDADPQVRREAMSSLGTIFGAGDPRSLAVLINGIRDPDHLVRRCAVGGLGSWPEDTVTEALAGCVNDPDRWVRYKVAWSLSRRPGATARAALDRLAADPDVDVSSAARHVLSTPVRLV